MVITSLKTPETNSNFADTFTESIKYLSTSMSVETKRTTQILTKTTLNGSPLVIQGISLIMLYVIIVLGGLFVILCGVFVSTYLHKHCINNCKPNARDDASLKKQDGYDSLEMNIQEPIAHSSDPAYLEPLSDARPHYEDIIL